MRHAKFFVLLLLIAIVPVSLFSQSATWAKIYHRNPSTGLGYLFGTSIARTPSGAFFISSYVDAYKFNLLKINAAGDILWSKSYIRDDPLGSNLSTNRPIVAGEKGYSRVIVGRLSRDGALIWKTWYAGTVHDDSKILPVYQKGALNPAEKENFILGCTSLGLDPDDGHLGAKIYRLDADGRVKRISWPPSPNSCTTPGTS